jgi:DNA-binding transcriptional ArsR family regulator
MTELDDRTPRPAHRTLDMESLKGLAHPLRVRILDVLTSYGPQTASSLADRLGESSGATSYHLRQLERHRFIREVEGRGSARERWWDRVPGGLSLEVDDLPDTPAARTASGIVLSEWNRHRQVLLEDFLRRGDDELPTEWREASVTNSAAVMVTAAQLKGLTDRLQGVLDDFVDEYREQKEHPVEGSRPVQIHLNAFPVMDAEEHREHYDDDRRDQGRG